MLLTILAAGCDSSTIAPVEEDGPAALQLSHSSVTLDRGDTARITAAVVNRRGVPLASPSAGSPTATHKVAWRSSNPSIADISRSGLIVGQRQGEVTITATTGLFSRTSKVTVQSQGKSVTISPKVDTLAAVGHESQLSVTVLNGSGKEQTNPSVTWTSLEPSIASVDASGLVTAVAVGAALITATAQGQTDSARVVVLSESSTSSPTVASVVVDPKAVEATAGEKKQFSATVKDGSGNEFTGTSVVWSSGDLDVATVDSNGMVTARNSGSASIRASVDGKSGSAVITVAEEDAGAPEPEPDPEPEPSDTPDFGAVIQGIRPRGFSQGSYTLLQPAAGATMYYVATNGSDANAGTSGAPFRTINKAAQVAVAGDVVTIRNGTYRESVLVKNGGTADKRIVFQAENRSGVVLTGGQYQFIPANWTSGVKQSGPIFVTVRGLIFREYGTLEPESSRTRHSVGAIRGWRIEDCLFDRAGYDGLGIRGDAVEVVRSTFQYNHENALTAWAPSGSSLKGVRVIDVVLRGNNTRPDPLGGSSSSKVVKFFRTSGTVVDNVESYENNGPGWWFDTDNTNYTIRNSYFHDNRNDSGSSTSGRGLFIEINYAPGLIENNVIANNERAGLDILNSQGVTVRGNLFVGNQRCIALTSVVRRQGPQYVLEDILIENNHCKDWGSNSAIHPLGSETSTPKEANIRADGNLYDPGSAANLSWWPHTGGLKTIKELQDKLGWEFNGRIGPIAWPQ